MTREFVVHFEPYDGGSRVDAEVFVKALSSLVEGFRSMANALAPAIAQRTSWSKVLVKEALTLAFSSVDKGSLDLRVVHGAAPAGAMLETERIAGIGWKAMTAAINGAAQGKTVISDVPLAAAENFARRSGRPRRQRSGVLVFAAGSSGLGLALGMAYQFGSDGNRAGPERVRPTPRNS